MQYHLISQISCLWYQVNVEAVNEKGHLHSHRLQVAFKVKSNEQKQTTIMRRIHQVDDGGKAL